MQKIVLVEFLDGYDGIKAVGNMMMLEEQF